MSISSVPWSKSPAPGSSSLSILWEGIQNLRGLSNLRDGRWVQPYVVVLITRKSRSVATMLRQSEPKLEPNGPFGARPPPAILFFPMRTAIGLLLLLLV